MDHSDRQLLKARLIELGFWRPAELGDPTIDKYAADALHSRTEEKLAGGIFLTSSGQAGGSPARKIEVVQGKFVHLLANGDTFPEAICLAALALPEFLKHHPECAV